MSKEVIKKWRWGGRVLLGIYLACLIYFMFFSESYGRTLAQQEYHYNLVPLKEICRFLKYRHTLGMAAVLINVVGNVAVFIPFGGAVPALYPKVRSFVQMAILSFSTSLVLEVLQLLLKVGCFDVDDLLLNTIGGCIGYLVFAGCRRFWRKHGEEKL